MFFKLKDSEKKFWKIRICKPSLWNSRERGELEERIGKIEVSLSNIYKNLYHGRKYTNL